MKRAYFASMVVLALVAVQVASTQSAGPKPIRDVSVDKKGAAKLDSLLKERREVLQVLVKLAKARYRQGAASIESAIWASLELLQADLDLAKTRRERVEIHKRTVALLRDLEKSADRRFRAGAAGQDDVLRAKASRLAAEIRLLREETAK